MSGHSNMLRQLVAAMATEQVARRYISEEYGFAEELATLGESNPEIARLTVAIREMAASSKVVTQEERNAGHALFRSIRDAFEATLKSSKPAAVIAAPMSPAEVAALHGITIKRCPTTDENGQLPKESREAKRARIAGNASSIATASGKRSGGSREKVEMVRSAVALPSVKVNVIPESKRAAARMAFFAAAVRVNHTQAALSEKATNVPVDQYYMTGKFRETKLMGQDPRDVLREHRDIIGSTPEGLAVLTRYEHYLLGAYAALDIIRRIVSCVHRGEALPETLRKAELIEPVRHWNAYPPNGIRTDEQTEARRVAEVPTQAAVKVGREWKAIPNAPQPTRYPVKGWTPLPNV